MLIEPNLTIDVSIIVPVYNAATMLPYCMESILAQTYRHFELICIDDAATDQSGQILANYAEKDPRIKVLVNDCNRGQAYSRNRGLDCAQGEYVCFVDADDMIHPQMVEVFLSTIKKTYAQVVIGQKIDLRSKVAVPHWREIENGASLQIKQSTQSLETLLQTRYASSVVWNKLYRADLLQGLRFIDGICFEDWVFVALLAHRIEQLAVVENLPLYYYNDLDYSTIRSPFTREKLNAYFVGIKAVAEFYTQPENIAYWPLIRKKRIMMSVKMMLSKVCKSHDPALQRHFIRLFGILRSKHYIKLSDLSLKSKIRLWRLK